MTDVGRLLVLVTPVYHVSVRPFPYDIWGVATSPKGVVLLVGRITEKATQRLAELKTGKKDLLIIVDDDSPVPKGWEGRALHLSSYLDVDEQGWPKSFAAEYLRPLLPQVMSRQQASLRYPRGVVGVFAVQYLLNRFSETRRALLADRPVKISEVKAPEILTYVNAQLARTRTGLKPLTLRTMERWRKAMLESSADSDFKVLHGYFLMGDPLPFLKNTLPGDLVTRLGRLTQAICAEKQEERARKSVSDYGDELFQQGATVTDHP